jgi:oligoendopeptidase F
MAATMSVPERDRTKVAEAYKWDLSDIYPSEPAWRAEKERITGEIPSLAAFQGRLGSSPDVLADALESLSRLDKELTRLYVYASMVSDEDTRASLAQGMQQEMQQIFASFSAQASYVEPEVLKIGRDAIEHAIAGAPRLAPYAFYLRDIARRAPHTLSDAEEKLLADAAPLAGAATNIYTILANADFPYPTVTLADGRTMKVDQAGYEDSLLLQNCIGGSGGRPIGTFANNTCFDVGSVVPPNYIFEGRRQEHIHIECKQLVP